MAALPTLDRRLAAYSVTAGMVIAGTGTTSAAIIYTDVPDTTYLFGGATPQGVDIDLNDDATVDFVLEFESNIDTGNDYSNVNIAIRTDGNSGDWIEGGYYYGVRALNSNYLISYSVSTWINSLGSKGQLARVGHFSVADWSSRNFIRRNYKMIGVRFNISASLHYGWIRVSVAKKGRAFTLYDYAYNEMPNEPTFSGVHLALQLEGAIGGQTELLATDVPGAGVTFAAPPKVIGYYFDPVKGKKMAKTGFKATLNGDGSAALLGVKKKVRLYDAKAFKNAYKNGTLCYQFLEDEPNQGMNFDLEVTLPDGTVVPDVAHLALRPPTITALTGITDPGAVVIVDGNWFGVKAPKAWVEYSVPGLQTKMVKLKVLKPYAFPDAKDKPNASCMNVNTGVSQIQVQLPAAWPDDFNNLSLEHDLVIDTGVGLACFRLLEP